jgi:hypothetical protein
MRTPNLSKLFFVIFVCTAKKSVAMKDQYQQKLAELRASQHTLIGKVGYYSGKLPLASQEELKILKEECRTLQQTALQNGSPKIAQKAKACQRVVWIELKRMSKK